MVLGTRTRHTTVAILAATLVLAGCNKAVSVTSSSGGSAYVDGVVNVKPATGDPVHGGTLTFGSYSEQGNLDPAKAIASGSTGGIELAAVYDVLMRWDSEQNVTVPQLAESLTPNEDHTVWTLTLRDGVTFSDGSPLDSAAVAYSLGRYAAGGASDARVWSSNVRATETPDAKTVVFRLNTAWPTFDYMLTVGPGMIVPRSAGEGPEFQPIGAGPFTFGHYRPKEELVLDANPRYWGGAPNLDHFRVVYLNDPTTTYDSLQAGSIDLAFIREPDIVDEAVAHAAPGFLNIVALGNAGLINAGQGRPGSDPRIRRALHMALPPTAVIDRAFGGAGTAGNELFPDTSVWHTDVGPLEYDPDEARRLVAEAKADGFDGRIVHVDGSDASSRETAMTLKAAWDAVGFDVEPVYMRTIADQTARIQVQRDYDTAGWGISWRDAGTYARMFATLHSQGNLSSGIATGEFDDLIAEVQAAGTLDEQRDVIGRIQQRWNEVVPALVFAPSPEFVMFGDDLHGVKENTNSMVLLDDAWLGDA